jgi:hypothetical protein
MPSRYPSPWIRLLRWKHLQAHLSKTQSGQPRDGHGLLASGALGNLAKMKPQDMDVLLVNEDGDVLGPGAAG